MIPNKGLSSEGRRLRVCFLLSKDVLNDPRVTRHAETLASAGYQVTVVCTGSTRPVSEESRRNYEIVRARSGVVDYLGALGKRRPPLSRTYGRTKLQTGYRSSWITMRVLLEFFVLYQVSLVRAARLARAHIYCANDLDTLAATILAAGFDSKVVYDAHELWPDMLVALPASFRALFRVLEHVLIKRADAVVTVNEFIAKLLASRYSIRQPTCVYNCPATTKLVIRKPKRRLKIALYQGAYVPERGLENIVKASHFLKPDVQIAFRGYGEIEEELRALAAGRSNVRFVPPVPMRALVSSASKADVGIVAFLPTGYNNYFASPNKLFEYLQAGLPIVASDLPFIRKIVHHNDIGELFDPWDPKSIARTINHVTRLTRLNHYRKNVLVAARKYSWEVEKEKLLRLYSDMSGAMLEVRSRQPLKPDR